MSQCVYCAATTNLNTSFNISLDDGKKVSVMICDAHAEDATVKTAKAAYLDKQAQIDDIMAKARALGLNITGMQQQGSLLIPVMEQPKARQMVQEEAPPVATDLEGDHIISTDLIDSRAGMMSIGGNTDMGHVSSLPSHSFSGLQDQLPQNARKGRAKMTMVEGRAGQPLAIPETRVDGTGTTRIRISKKEDDGRLQTRFKKMAKDTIDHDRVPNFARAGYQNTQTDCPICRGSCVVKQNVNGRVQEVSCPKCNGSGVISTY